MDRGGYLILLIVFLAWLHFGQCWIEGRRNWKKEYQGALKSKDPEEIADSLAYKDFFFLPFLLLTLLLFAGLARLFL